MNRNRLLWAARRGMLELDLLLRPFVENFYDGLEDNDKLRFEVLLEQEDQVLYEWLFMSRAPADPEMRDIVEMILASRA